MIRVCQFCGRHLNELHDPERARLYEVNQLWITFPAWGDYCDQAPVRSVYGGNVYLHLPLTVDQVLAEFLEMEKDLL